MRILKQIFTGIIFLNLLLPQSVIANTKQKVIALYPAVSSNSDLNAINLECAAALRNHLQDSYSIVDLKSSQKITKQSHHKSDNYKEIFSLINQAKNLLKNKKYEDSLGVLNQAEDLFKNQYSISISNLRVDLQLTRAYIHYKTSNFEKAKSYARNVFLNQRQVSFKGYSRKFKSFLKKIKENTSSEKTSKVYIESTPQSVQVFINGYYYGETPNEFLIPSGKNKIALYSYGRKPFVKMVDYKNDQYNKIHTNLKWNQKSLRQKNKLWNEVDAVERLSLLTQFSKKLGHHQTIVIDIQKEKGVFYPTAQIYDHEYTQPFRLIKFPKKVKNLKEHSDKILKFFLKKIHAHLSNDAIDYWKGDFDQQIVLDTRIKNRKRKPLYKKNGFWIGVGAFVLSGIAVGVLASQNQSQQSGTGSIHIDLESLR